MMKIVYICYKIYMYQWCVIELFINRWDAGETIENWWIEYRYAVTGWRNVHMGSNIELVNVKRLQLIPSNWKHHYTLIVIRGLTSNVPSISRYIHKGYPVLCFVVIWYLTGTLAITLLLQCQWNSPKPHGRMCRNLLNLIWTQQM